MGKVRLKESLEVLVGHVQGRRSNNSCGPFTNETHGKREKERVEDGRFRRFCAGILQDGNSFFYYYF